MLSLALFEVTDARPVSQLSDAFETLCDAEAMSALPPNSGHWGCPLCAIGGT
jgi:hypothetical protein